MDPAAIFIILLIIGIIVLVIWFLIVFSRRRAQQIQQLQGGGMGVNNAPAAGAGQGQTGWTEPQPIPGPRGKCGLYTFPARGPGQPTIPTLNTTVLDNLTPGELGNVTCTDPDQLVVQKVNQTCKGDSTLGNVCYGASGVEYQQGQTRQFYQECHSTKCNDILAVTALNFDPADNSNNTACLQFNSTDPTRSISGQNCNLQNSSQILRIERKTPSGQTTDDGPYGRLVDRVSGLCVVPSSVPPSPGTTLQLANCAPSDGYVWWFFPPTPTITTRTIDGVQIPVKTVAPQQLVYYPNNGKEPPKGEDLRKFIENKNPLSMAVPLDMNGNSLYGLPITLQPLATNFKTNEGKAANAQVIDYWLYRTIRQTPITCLGCGTNFNF